MNITIIKGTYHKTGMVSHLVDRFIEGVKSVDNTANIEVFDLLDKKVKFCKGCLNCTKNPELPIGNCVISDDATKIFPKMLKSDVVVFATPVYDLGPTALMKIFLERCVCMSSGEGLLRPRNKKIKGKIGVIILSTRAPAIINDLFFTSYPKMILKEMCKWFGCEKEIILSAGGMETYPKSNEYFLKKSYSLGEKIAKKLKRKSNLRLS